MGKKRVEKGDLESRFRKLEIHLAYLAGVGTVVLGFLGWTYFHTIPTAIEETISKHVGEGTLTRITDADKKAKSILSVTDLQEEVQSICESERKLQEEVRKINEARECKNPKTECVCQRDEGKTGDDLAMLVLCVSRCPDGRLRGIEIKEIIATTDEDKVKCKKLNLQPKVTWK